MIMKQTDLHYRFDHRLEMSKQGAGWIFQSFIVINFTKRLHLNGAIIQKYPQQSKIDFWYITVNSWSLQGTTEHFPM